MSAESSRATWSYTYEKGLVETIQVLVNIPMLKGQNGWIAEGWRSITNKFNERFPHAQFTKQRVQEKEKELKGTKIIRQARTNSGVGWNDTLGMINAEPKIWAKLIEDNPKVSKFRKKAFSLFNSLEPLYEGSIATGDLNFIVEQRVEPTPQRTEQRVEPIPQRSILEQSTHNTAPIQSAATNQTSEDVEGFSGKKRKQSQMAARLGDYIDFRKDQIEKTMNELNEKKKREDDYFVQKCIDIADCNELFQSEINRQIFVSTKNPNVRLIWLKKRISQGSRPSFGHGGSIAPSHT
ncbi:hypothetical protein PVAP13_5NG251081 [Panicum virgatum]|uniref:Myb/SANT-like domain-containing protein n=1 Tax=Panicum virgatum TaxID=38727 RepID=A0A8T0RX22_PANVG|nr:hypothetical protein PVAP13_5NG251081 [Panicum virgatum]